MTPTTHELHLNVNANGKIYSLDFRQAFRFGYSLLRTRKFKEACQVFEAMTHLDASDRLATIMLAYCKAGMKDYQTSNALLSKVFVEEKDTRADQLHTGFVYLSVGMWNDAIEEFATIARQSPDLPVICLLLGDLFAFKKNRTKAMMCWRLAAARDHDDGAVAAVARQLVSAQTKSLVSQ